jgi:hypothetical protein
MKNIDLNKVWIGLIAGILAPSITLWLYYLINYSGMSIERFVHFLKQGDIFTPLISLCVLVNLAIFYPFIWKEKWNGAKGVIGATFIWAALVIFLKFFT